MAVERVIDLAGQRYADREYEGRLPEPDASGESGAARRSAEAAARLRRRVREQVTVPRPYLDRADLVDLLLVLGVSDW
jgi:hypothetical protein